MRFADILNLTWQAEVFQTLVTIFETFFSTPDIRSQSTIPDSILKNGDSEKWFPMTKNDSLNTELVFHYLLLYLYTR